MERLNELVSSLVVKKGGPEKNTNLGRLKSKVLQGPKGEKRHEKPMEKDVKKA